MTATGSEAHSTVNLAAVASKGAMKTASGQVIRITLQLLSVVVLTRFLEPNDYGLMAIILAITGMASLLCDMGFSLATAQAKSLSREQRDRIFWLNTSVGIVLGCFLAAGAPLLAEFYKNPEIEIVAQIMAVTFLLAGITTQYRASLVRSLRFGRIAFVEVMSQFLSLIAAIFLAIAGFGYWALVAQALGAAALTAIGIVWSAKWIPRISRKPAPIRNLVGYGAAAMTTQLVNYASVNTPGLALGRLATASSVGLYTKGFQLFSLPLTQIAAPLTSVALPILSRIKDEPERFQKYIQRAQIVMTYCLGMTMCAIAIGGQPLVSLVLGEQWRPAGSVTQILAIGGIFQTMGYVNYWVFLAKGRMPVLLFFEGILRVAMIPVIIIGAAWGLNTTAAAYSMGLALIWIASTFLGLPRVGIPASAMARNAIRPLILITVTYGSSSLCRELMIDSGFQDLAVLSASYTVALITIALFLILKIYRLDLKSIVHTASRIKQ